jgi:hypothetical protein
MQIQRRRRACGVAMEVAAEREWMKTSRSVDGSVWTERAPEIIEISN